MVMNKEPMMKPVCPHCKSQMKPFKFVGYYDELVGWKCECQELPDAEIVHGAYAE